MKDKETELTIVVDIAKFPREYWTDGKNPFMKIDDHLMDDVADWIGDQVPIRHDGVAVELIGKCAAPVLLLIGGVLREHNCIKLTYLKPGWSPLVIWDDNGECGC
jgi:hypothetical protein